MSRKKSDGIFFNFHKNLIFFFSSREGKIYFHDLLYFTLYLYFKEKKVFEDLSKKGEYELREAERSFLLVVERKTQNPDQTKLFLHKVKKNK